MEEHDATGRTISNRLIVSDVAEYSRSACVVVDASGGNEKGNGSRWITRTERSGAL